MPFESQTLPRSVEGSRDCEAKPQVPGHLFEPQRYQWIEPRRASSRNERGERTGAHQQAGNRRIHQRVVRLCLEQETADEAAHVPRAEHPDRQSGAQISRRGAQHRS